MPVNYDKSEIKALILIIADAFEEEIELDSAYDIIVNSAEIPKMDFFECFSELVEANMIYITESDGKKLCAVTETGSMTAESLSDGFRYINIGKILEKAKREYERTVEGIEYKTGIREASGGYYLDFSFSQNGVEKCGVSIWFGSAERAKAALRIAEKDPAYFHAHIMNYIDRD